MPSSLKHGKRESREWFAAIAREHGGDGPLFVLDVGPGVGTYRKLMADVPVLQIWTAVEAWGPYVKEYSLAEIYNAVIVQDIRQFQWTGLWHVVIFGDVLEHMAKVNALSVVAKARQHSRHVLISLPVKVMHQGEHGGNPFEAHVHHWSHEQVVEAWPDARRIDKFPADRPNATRIGVYVIPGVAG